MKMFDVDPEALGDGGIDPAEFEDEAELDGDDLDYNENEMDVRCAGCDETHCDGCDALEAFIDGEE